MRELTDDPVYEMLDQRFPELQLDYMLLSAEESPAGEAGHKEAVLTALRLMNRRSRIGNLLVFPPITADPAKMQGKPVDPERFFAENGTILREDGVRETPAPGEMCYWAAFFDPPYGVPYNKTDFYLLNAALFPIPLKKDPLQIMSWSGDFTNYFDQGNEWWGTALWSIYDPLMQRYVIIGASLTD